MTRGASGLVDAITVFTKMEGVWYPAGIETYWYDSDEELRADSEGCFIVSLPVVRFRSEPT
jgi:hypothetical protein